MNTDSVPSARVPPSLLLVEDDKDTRELLALQLNSHGFEVDQACDGQQALAQLEFDDYDLIITDVLMPHLDGFGLARAVRQDARLAGLPILFFTAHYLEEEDELLAYRLGVDCYLRKPVEEALLIRTLRDLLAKKGLQQDIGRFVSLLQESYQDEHQSRTLNQLVRKLHELEASERRLALQRGRYINMLAAAPDAVVVCDAQGGIIEVNAATLTLSGYEAEELVGQPLEILVPEAQRSVHAIHRTRLIASAETLLHKPRQQRFKLRCRNGSLLPVEINVGVSRNSGEVVATAVIRDVSQQEQSATRLRLYHEALEACGDGVLITDQNLPQHPIVYANPAMCRITGFCADELLGKSASLFYGKDLDQPGLREIRSAIAKGKHASALLRNYRKDGELFWAQVHVAPVGNDGQIHHYVGITRDVTDNVRYQQALEHQANFDELTGLANRNLLRDRLEQAIIQAQRNKCQVALLFLDLDRFKVINDSLGHAVGDRVIQLLGTRLSAHLRRGDTVARWGGDEFVFVVNDVVHRESVIAIIDQLLAVVSQPIPIEGQQFICDGSIGCCFYPLDGQDIDTLLRRADAAMYVAKSCAGNAYHFYDDSLNEKVEQRLHLEMGLRTAMQKGELVVHYQPQIDTQTGQMIGVEALVRWVRDKELLLPQHFIPLAEQAGLIEPLGIWVLKQACKDLQKLKLLDSGVRVAVNVAYQQIVQPTFAQQLSAVLMETGLPPAQLELEVTERVMLNDDGVVQRNLEAVRELGVGLSLDDFGTGYSSLSYLQRYPFDTLKIDRSFVMRLSLEDSAHALCEAIIGMSRALQLTVIAEGVETNHQSSLLRAMECHRQQGFLFSEPLSLADLQRRLKHTSVAVDDHTGVRGA